MVVPTLQEAFAPLKNTDETIRDLMRIVIDHTHTTLTKLAPHLLSGDGRSVYTLEIVSPQVFRVQRA